MPLGYVGPNNQWITAADTPAAAGEFYIGAVAWAARPTPAAAGVGAVITVTDFPAGGVSRWYSDGTSWRPVNGSVLIGRGGGSLASPIFSSTPGAAAETYFGPLLTIPAGMIPPYARICGEALLRRTVGGAATDICMILSTSNVAASTPSVNSCFAFGFSAATAIQDTRFNGVAQFSTATNQYTSSYGASNFTNGASLLRTMSTQVDTTVPMYVTFNNDTSVADAIGLISYSFWLEA